MAPKNGIIHEKKLFSRELEEEMTVLVYLPNTYSPLYKYHTVIAQDGHDYFRLGKIGRQAEELMSKGKLTAASLSASPIKMCGSEETHTIPKALSSPHINGLSQMSSFLLSTKNTRLIKSDTAAR